jgi:hypothetical protein
MSDPKRLLDAAPAEGLARSLLESAMAPDPTSDQREAMWGALAPHLPASTGGHGSPSGVHSSGAPGGLAGSAGAGAAIVKGAGLLVLAGGLTTTLALAVHHPSRLDAPPAPVATLVAPVASDPPARTAEPAPVEIPSSPPVQATPRRATAGKTSSAKQSSEESTTPSDALRLESQAVLEAREALRSGDCGDALTRLDEARSRFGAGALPQEREVLAIEALDCSGRKDAASERAAAFLRNYPTSPHAASVRRFLR